jgi:hypothetical protein
MSGHVFVVGELVRVPLLDELGRLDEWLPGGGRELPPLLAGALTQEVVLALLVVASGAEV